MWYAQQPQTFQAEVNESVRSSLDRLRPKSQFDLPDWELVQRSIFSSLLGTASNAEIYDKKFLIRENLNAAGTLWHYRPLFPAVLSAYRKYLWDDLMEFVENEERSLLEVCRSADTTNDTRGQSLESWDQAGCRRDLVNSRPIPATAFPQSDRN